MRQIEGYDVKKKKAGKPEQRWIDRIQKDKTTEQKLEEKSNNERHKSKI